MKQNESDNSHKRILKATGIFGFSQVLRIAIGLVSSKLVAVFLGPVGIGTFGLLNNTLTIIASITNFGINVTSVKEIAVAGVEKDPIKFSKTILLLKRFALFTGILGAGLTIILSKFLSQWTFGTTEYYFWFIVLSVNFIFSSISANRMALLQGTRNIKAIAVSGVLSSFFTAILIIPIYYFFRFQGIVPVIIITSLVGLLINLYLTRKLKTSSVKLSFSETITKSKPLIVLGFLLSINVIFGQICTYLIKLYFNHSGTSVEILGFYEVSMIILISYVGMIFSAMSTDFYPRLSAVNKDNSKVRELVNDQIEMGLLLMTPAILFLYLSAPFLIEVLYTKEFLDVVLILKAALLAIIIKAIIWPFAYIILAKGEKKLYFKQELLGDFMNVTLTIMLYKILGVIGIGIAMVINYTIYGVYVFYIIHKKFDFSLRKNTLLIMIKCLILGGGSCGVVFFMSDFNASIMLSILLFLSIIFSYIELNKRVGIVNILLSVKQKLKR